MCNAGDSEFTVFRDELVDAGLLIPLGVPGLFGRSGTFERVIDQFEGYASRAAAPFKPEVMRFPPLFNRTSYEKNGHIHNFPDLLGSIHGFMGSERDHMNLLGTFERGEDWSAHLSSTNMMLVPAACYPLYPTATGTLPEGGRLVDLKTFVFRREPSDDPARLQSFRMREFVRLGTPDQAFAHRNEWMERALGMLRALGLEAEAVVANDPFFGRGGKVMKATQREQNLKYELVVPIYASESPTAVGSCNYHLDHFGEIYAIRTADGRVAHSACIGFGLERVALALFKKHGLDPETWPADVRGVLDAQVAQVPLTPAG